MAMIVANVARLKPEIRLADAISRFEASLSSDQKSDFSQQRRTALSSPPTASDVMRFTGHIDRRVAGGGGRCLGPRFTNFMQGVQQFAALGDVLVGGSQNIIACGVWTLVRMSILAVINVNSYIEKVSLVMMEIGRSIPRHQEMALVYPRSDALQAHIQEYYIVVVGLCQSFMDFAHMTKIQKLALALSDVKIKSTQSELKSWAYEIEEEVRLLLAKRIEEEVKQNSSFRALSQRVSKTFLLQQEVTAKLRILKQCSQHNHETAWKQIRKLGNTKLFLGTAPYESWKSTTGSSTLVYLGILGCGKSVMMANIVDDLNAYTKDKNAFVIYFFLRQNISEILEARTVIGSIVRQILGKMTGFTNIIPSDRMNFDFEAMMELLKSILDPKHDLYLILDGLHMASPSERNAVVDFLQGLQKQHCLRICASFRQEPNVALDATLRFFNPDEKVSMPENESDIEAFIENELACRLESGALKLGDATLITICTLQTDEEIRDALEDLPYDLEEIYYQLLWRQGQAQSQYPQRILEIITALQRPLTTSEFREALSVSAGDTTWTASKLLHDIYSALSTCGCLVRVDEEELTVRFMHPTVGQFFLGRFHDSDGDPVTVEHCHQVMSEIIVTYLNYGVFDTEVSTFRVPQIKVGATPSKVVSSTMDSTSAIQGLSLKLLKRRKLPNFDIGKTVAQELHKGKQLEIINYDFQHYAYPCYIFHVRKSQNMKTSIGRLLLNLLEKNNGTGIEQLNSNEAWKIAIDNNHTPLAQLILEYRSELTVKIAKPLSRALCRGQEEMINVVLRALDEGHPLYSLQSLLQEDFIHYTDMPCLHACFGSMEGYMNLHDKKPHVCMSGRSLITCAIITNSIQNIKYLLHDSHRKWNINYGLNKKTPIREAVARGHMTSLRILLGTKKVVLGYGEQEELIRLAEERGYYKMVQMLKSSRNFGEAPKEMPWIDEIDEPAEKQWEEKVLENSRNNSPT